MEATWVLPESNQPSRVSVSLVKVFPSPQWGQVKPSGSSSEASFKNQTLEPAALNSSDTLAMVSGVQTGLWQLSQ